MAEWPEAREESGERRESPEEENRPLAQQEGKEALVAWVGWVLGPAAWALHQGIGYAMVPWLCNLGTRWPYHALTAFALALCVVSALGARRALRRSRKVRPEHSRHRLRMMALVGLMLSTAAFGGILVEYLPSFVLELCTGV